jgi:hypothetical protein
MPYSDAVRTIQNHGLGVRFYGNNRYPVTNQIPAPGTRLERGKGIVNIYFPNRK